MVYFVYILSSSNNNAIYVGITNNLQRRVYEHKTDMIEGFTKRYKIHKLVYVEETRDVKSAIAREKQIKSWSRKRKNDLINSINPQWNDLSIE